MAKASTEKDTKTKTVGASAKDLGFKYGVPELAEAMGIQEASARVALRNKGVAKAGRAYGWNTKAELDDVIATLRADAPAKSNAKAAPAKASPAKAKPSRKAA